MADNNLRQGGANAWRNGYLKYLLPEVAAFNLSSTASQPEPISAPTTQKFWLEGLSANLTVRVTVGPSATSDRAALNLPALPGVCKATPYTKTTQGQFIFQKPLTLNSETLPATFLLGSGFRVGDDGANPAFGPSGCDGVLLELTIDPTQYPGTFINGQVYVAVTAEYTGSWWDVEAITKLFGQLSLTTVDPLLIATGGE